MALPGEVACKDMDRPQTGVAGRNAVVPLGLERCEEACDALDREVRDIQAVHGAAPLPGREAQKQQQRVAIAADRVRTQAPLCGQEILEERHEVTAQGLSL